MPAASPRSPGRPRSRVRWDRVSRAAMLFGLCLLLYLAVSPVRTLIADVHLSAQRRAQLAQLRHHGAALRATERELRSTATADIGARNLGFVRPGEHEYIVSGLPDN